MYRTYLTLTDFIDHCERVVDQRVYVQPSQRSQALHGGVVQLITSTILITALAREEGRPILLARLLVETAELWNDSRSAVVAINARARSAAELLGAALRTAGLSVEPGVLLEPGMFDDLVKFQTDHDLWHLAGDMRDIPGRRLVAGSRMREAG